MTNNKYAPQGTYATLVIVGRVDAVNRSAHLKCFDGSPALELIVKTSKPGKDNSVKEHYHQICIFDANTKAFVERYHIGQLIRAICDVASRGYQGKYYSTAIVKTIYPLPDPTGAVPPPATDDVFAE